MNFIKENIKGKKSRKKGFTLIELLIAASIAGIVISSQMLILCKYMKIHKKEIMKSRESFYVNQAFMIIEHQVNIASSVSVKDNIITLKSYEEDKDGRHIYNKPKYDYIKKNRSLNPSVVITDGLEHSSYSNKILEDIKGFKAEQVDQLVYISIEMMGGNIYKRCLGLERIKDIP